MTNSQRRRYISREDRAVVAIRLLLDTEGLVYRKWAEEHRAKAGDWLVDKDGDVYTVDAAVFERTYRQIGQGRYVKTASVWAVRADKAGSVRTKEGATAYEAGDYIVSNSADGFDEYAISARKFESLYTPADDSEGVLL